MKVFFVLAHTWAGLQVSSQCTYAFPQTSESQTSPDPAFLRPTFTSIIEDFNPDHIVLLSQVNAAMPGVTVAYDVGHPFTHRPGKDGVEGRRKDFFEGVDLHVDSRRFQQLSGTF